MSSLRSGPARGVVRWKMEINLKASVTEGIIFGEKNLARAGGPVDAARLEGYPSPLFFEPSGTPFFVFVRVPVDVT